MSPRNRTPDKDSAENSTAVAEQPGADAATTAADQPHTEGGDNAPGFAERVGEKTYKPLPDPFGIAADYLAGVRLMENKKERTMAIQFGDGSTEAKPSQERHRHGQSGRLPLEPLGADVDTPYTV